MSCKIKMGVTHLMRGVYLSIKERVTTTMKRRKRGGVGRTSHGWLPPHSYIYIGHTPLLPALSCFPFLTLLLQTMAVA
jgi:hypothetical protein